MSSSALIETFGHIVFSFTQGVTEHYNPAEPEYTEESFGYNPLQSTGREWYSHPVDEIIYQEYGDREATRFDFLPFISRNIRFMNACSIEEIDEPLLEQENKTTAMAWKRFRPSVLQTICKSMCIGASISLLTATVIGAIYVTLAFLIYKTVMNCQYQKDKMTSREQWMRTIADIASCAFLYISPLLTLLCLFRSFQLKGLKRRLILICFIMYCLDSLYRGTLQFVGKPFFELSILYKVPVYVLFLGSGVLQFYLVARHFFIWSRTKQAGLICKMAVPSICNVVISAFVVRYLIYPAFNKEKKEQRKLLIALFSPFLGLVLKAISRICVQRLWNITHPGYSYVLLAQLYLISAVMFRALQADLQSLPYIVVLGIVHGAAEVIERSTIVVIDHICHLLWKKTPAPWGGFRTPRRERLLADIVIMSMLFEATAIVSVNGFLRLYQLIFLETSSVSSVLKEFFLATSVQLIIEWFFTSVSLAIETRYQNMAVMAVWRRQWKRHILVAIITVLPIAVWTSVNILGIVHGRFLNEPLNQCKMPFS